MPHAHSPEGPDPGPARRHRPDERFPGERDLKDRALDVAAEGITIADVSLPGGPLVYVNDGFERLTGYAAAEVLGRNCRFLQGEETDPAAREEIRRAIRERRALVVEILNYRKDGTPFWNRLSLTPVAGAAGETSHYIGVQSDVTARRRAEDELREANRQLAIVDARMRRNLEAAALVQRSLLPHDLPDMPGVRFAWSFRPSEELAGDVLGIVPIDAHEVGLYVIDVSGHGVAASLLSVTLSHWLEPARGPSSLLLTSDPAAGTSLATPPARVAERLSAAFPFDTRTALYFTMLYGVLDIAARSFRFVCAAHPSPILLPRGGEPREIACAGLPIGIVPGATFEETRADLAPGDRVFIFSDGLTEAQDPAGQEFRVERLLAEIGRTRHEPLDAAVAEIVRTAELWSGPGGHKDDMSIVALEMEKP